MSLYKWYSKKKLIANANWVIVLEFRPTTTSDAAKDAKITFIFLFSTWETKYHQPKAIIGRTFSFSLFFMLSRVAYLLPLHGVKNPNKKVHMSAHCWI